VRRREWGRATSGSQSDKATSKGCSPLVCTKKLCWKSTSNLICFSTSASSFAILSVVKLNCSSVVFAASWQFMTNMFLSTSSKSWLRLWHPSRYGSSASSRILEKPPSRSESGIKEVLQEIINCFSSLRAS